MTTPVDASKDDDEKEKEGKPADPPKTTSIWLIIGGILALIVVGILLYRWIRNKK